MAKKIKKRTITIIGVITAAILAFFGKIFFLENQPETVALYGIVTPRYMEFNSKFTAYRGKKSLSQVKALVNLVIANNATGNKIVSINKITTNKELLEMVKILDGREYNISAEFDNEGFITNIVITAIEETKNQI